MKSDSGHEKIEELIIENQRLLTENNIILKKMHRSAVWAFWLRIVWLIVFFGLPILAYYYVLLPYYEVLQSTFGSLQIGLPSLPAWSDTFAP